MLGDAMTPPDILQSLVDEARAGITDLVQTMQQYRREEPNPNERATFMFQSEMASLIAVVRRGNLVLRWRNEQ
eukprot:13169310-Alexandrium_andersonii.AAC.1